MSHTYQCVAEFCDGKTFLIYDARRDAAFNSNLAQIVAAEGRRRVKSGESDAGMIRERRADDREVVE